MVEDFFISAFPFFFVELILFWYIFLEEKRLGVCPWCEGTTTREVDATHREGPNPARLAQVFGLTSWFDFHVRT